MRTRLVCVSAGMSIGLVALACAAPKHVNTTSAPSPTFCDSVRATLADSNATIDVSPRPLNQEIPIPPGRGGTGSLQHIRVVVDTLGAPIMSTYETLAETHPAFGQRVKSAVAGWRFSPGKQAGCVVRHTFVLHLEY